MFVPENAHLVLVDDEPQLLEVNLWLLKEMGWTNVHGAASVKELVAYLEQSLRQENPVDLVLMDVVMPEMNGIEGTKLLRQTPTFSDTAIIMLTSMKDKTTLESALEAGATDYLLKPFDEIELRARIRNALRLKHEIQKRKQSEAELLQLSQALISKQIQTESTLYQDPLTGIYNRRAFDKKLEDEWLNCYIHQKPLSLIMVDVDHFKNINDLYGHLRGDQVLQAVAQTLLHKNSDSFVARYGGEEFMILLAGMDQHESILIAEDLRQSLENLKVSQLDVELDQVLSASFGVATVLPGECPDSQLLLEMVDAAMYNAKNNGRNQVASA